MLGTLLNQINGYSDHYFSERIFTNTAKDFHSYLVIDHMETPEFNDSFWEDSSTHQKIKALPLLQAVTPSPYDPDKTPKTTPTRVSQLRISEIITPNTMLLPT